MAFVWELINDASIPWTERQDALDRIYLDPGVPQERTTNSFWLKAPHPQLQNTQSTELPLTADIAIIGSGISATSVARTLLQHNAQSKILMLDARDICSGATGRNGGHCLETMEDYLKLRETYGQQ